MGWICFCSQQNSLNFHKSSSSPEYDWKHWNEHWQWQVFFILKLSLFNPPTWHTVGCYSLWQSLSLVCHTEWIMFDLAAWFCIMSTSCAHRMHLFFGKLRLLCFCIPVKSAVNCVCSHVLWISVSHLRGSMTSLESSHSGFSQLSAATTSSSQSQSSSMISR